MNELQALTQGLLESAGAVAVGFCTKESLAGGPPSTDLSYVLPGAKSSVTFAVALDQELIVRFLKKQDRLSHDHDNVRANTLASGMALELSNFLNNKGFPSVPVASNIVYRTDTPHGALDELPRISHRYLAVRSGIGHFGLSGNVICREHGAGIILGSVVTEAEFEPGAPLPEQDNYCDACKLCQAACASGLMHADEKVTISMGGFEFSYAKRRHHNRCDYVCGGFSGLHPSGKWSTWSPARFPIPEKDEEFLPALLKSAKSYAKRPFPGGGFCHFLVPGNRVVLTCGHCQLVCVADKDERAARYKMITGSGVVVQNPDGSLEAVTPEEAQKRIAAMSPETRALYELA